ncbi:unnamed protein product [Spirodela intermedia]|uniref:RING-type domain-containing protein n=1 Tax=Spirodela intermedia TaxID=51605 RepID=A0A7I8ITZ7_SPIIN|nr:unnamed protein product [Spirodela intermedia]CAA6660608.1 unnamed protein product [Spirodela intermedia]
MEAGECSAIGGEGDGIWAKLVPTDAQCSGIDITSGDMVIHSEVTCFSTRSKAGPIIVDEAIVGTEETVNIKYGSEIVSGPHREGHLVFHFKETSFQKQDTKALMIPLDVEHAKCSICLNIWHDVVTVSPCLHNFCNGCFSEWLRRSEKKCRDVVCPQCRATLQSVGRNYFLRNIEEAILQTFPLLRTSNDELALLDNRASVRSNLVLGAQKPSSRNRSSGFSSEESFASGLACPQCGNLIGGFKCNRATAHLQCQACSGMMPSRPDVGVPQQCLGCDRAFCGAYWRAQGSDPGGEYAICSPETFQPASRWAISRVPDTTHEYNRYEQDITEWCIRQMGKTVQATVLEWITNLTTGNRYLNRARLQLKHAEAVTSRTHLCSDCFCKLVNFLLYWFRLSMPRHLLPPDASNREDCWYGYACRTQHRNADHAKKRNHVCRPTRG